MNGIDKNKKVEVYFNLHKKCWSIRQAGRPVVHSDFVEIKEPQFVVQQGGNARVRREKKKNVQELERTGLHKLYSNIFKKVLYAPNIKSWKNMDEDKNNINPTFYKFKSNKL